MGCRQAEYHPSELLCPTTLCWVPAARCLAALAQDGFVELNRLPHALDGLGAEQVVLLAILLQVTRAVWISMQA